MVILMISMIFLKKSRVYTGCDCSHRIPPLGYQSFPEEMTGLIRYSPSHRRRWGSGNGNKSCYREGGPLHDKEPSTTLDVVLLRSHNDWRGQIARCIRDGSHSFTHRWSSEDRRAIICLPLRTPSEERNLFIFRHEPLVLQYCPACRTAFQEPYCLRDHVHAETLWNKNKQQLKDCSLFGDDVKDPISVLWGPAHHSVPPSRVHGNFWAVAQSTGTNEGKPSIAPLIKGFPWSLRQSVPPYRLPKLPAEQLSPRCTFRSLESSHPESIPCTS